MAKTPESPPTDLDNESKRLWKTTIEALKAQGTWEQHDVTTLDRYVRAWERGRLAREGVDELTTVGSTGQLVPHPNLKTAREAEQDAHRYAEALILTPEARSRHGIEAAPSTGDPFEGVLG